MPALLTEASKIRRGSAPQELSLKNRRSFRDILFVTKLNSATCKWRFLKLREWVKTGGANTHRLKRPSYKDDRALGGSDEIR
jgi:hypothetical protein